MAAGSADEALSLIDTACPDVVLSDLVMPDKDGYALLRELRERGYQVPCVAVTAMVREEERARTRAAGFDQHISKPVNPSELIFTIDRFRKSGSIRTSRSSGSTR